jgi:shikimate dehydrogenase
MKKFGLIGYPLEHSFSKDYFTKKFESELLIDCSYMNYPIQDLSQFRNFIEDNPDLLGLNVTIPYKQKIIDFLDDIDKEASEIGAVNTIKIKRNKNKCRLTGFNTDIYGFEKPLLEKLKHEHKSALILGTGGASKAVAYILKKLDITFRYVSRYPKTNEIYSYENVTQNVIRSNRIIINTTPLGMYPHTNECPAIPYDAIGPEHILYDLIYNPPKTLFLSKGEQHNATIINGLPMLYIQAEKSWEIWNS